MQVQILPATALAVANKELSKLDLAFIVDVDVVVGLEVEAGAVAVVRVVIDFTGVEVVLGGLIVEVAVVTPLEVPVVTVLASRLRRRFFFSLDSPSIRTGTILPRQP